MQFNGVFIGLFFVLLTQSLSGFSGRAVVGPLDGSLTFAGINNEQTMKGLAEARLFVQSARSAGWADGDIVTALVDSLDKDTAFSTTSYSLKNDVNHVWFFLGAMAMLGVISVGYIIYWLIQRKQDDSTVSPSSATLCDQQVPGGDGRSSGVGRRVEGSSVARDGHELEALEKIEKELAAVRETVMLQEAKK